MICPCELVERPAQPVLSVRTRTPVERLPEVFQRVYGSIIQYLGEVRAQPAGPAFAAYRNMDMQDLDVEVGFPVQATLPGRGEIKPGEIPGGQQATCVYTGPYHGVGEAYEALSAWLKEKGLQASGVAYEIYLNDPGSTPPEELRTEVMFPLVTS